VQKRRCGKHDFIDGGIAEKSERQRDLFVF